MTTSECAWRGADGASKRKDNKSFYVDAMCSAETNECGYQICDECSEEMASLASPLSELLNHSVAKSTAKKYKGAFAQWTRWTRWAEEQGMEALPAKPIHVALYLTKLTQEADSAAPVSAAVYAIAWKHQVSGWDNPCCDKIVTRTLNAAQRVCTRPKPRKDPAMKAMIRKLFDILTQSGSLHDLQMITLIVLGFAGMMRWDDLSHIYADEVEVTSNYYISFSGGTKNDQRRHRH